MEFITLENKDNITLIKDVLLYPLKVNRDESGILVETLRKDWKDIYGKNREFAMQYFSVTDPWIARDENLWHLHKDQEDRFLVAQGKIIVAVADNRKDSETRGVLNLFYMQSQINPYILLIPKDTLHGFMVVSKTEGILLNFPTQLYNPSDEIRIHHKEAKVAFADGSDFAWEKIRRLLNQS